MLQQNIAGLGWLVCFFGITPCHRPSSPAINTQNLQSPIHSSWNPDFFKPQKNILLEQKRVSAARLFSFCSDREMMLQRSDRVFQDQKGQVWYRSLRLVLQSKIMIHYSVIFIVFVFPYYMYIYAFIYSSLMIISPIVWKEKLRAKESSEHILELLISIIMLLILSWSILWCSVFFRSIPIISRSLFRIN